MDRASLYRGPSKGSFSNRPGFRRHDGRSDGIGIVRVASFLITSIAFIWFTALYIGFQYIHLEDQVRVHQLCTTSSSDARDPRASIQHLRQVSLSSSTKSADEFLVEISNLTSKDPVSAPSLTTREEVLGEKGDLTSQFDHESTDKFALASLTCKRYGGPENFDSFKELIYWEDIPSDAKQVSPFLRKSGPRQYLTFDPDHGGWNNIRMSMETAVALALAMGRTLVLPPEQRIYLIDQANSSTKTQKSKFGFNDFFPMDRISKEQAGFDIISMEQYLEQQKGMFRVHSDNFSSVESDAIAYPPGNRTNWDGASEEERKTLRGWLRSVSYVPTHWDPNHCLAGFPSTDQETDLKELQQIGVDVAKENPHPGLFVDRPSPLDGTARDRLRENWGGRKSLCLYDAEMQSAPSIHIATEKGTDSRLLVHFYEFLFFQNYQHDLWIKRFVRDHLRYTDEIMCAAARVIAAIRSRVRHRHVRDLSIVGNKRGEYDSMHGTLEFLYWYTGRVSLGSSAWLGRW
jgi:GDP-fucose protein O-fucosyltransferase